MTETSVTPETTARFIDNAPQQVAVTVAVQNEMIRYGLTAMLDALPSVRDVHQCAGLGRGLECVRVCPIDVLIVSCVDEDEEELRLLSEEAAARGVKVLYLLDQADQRRLMQTPQSPDGFLLQTELTQRVLANALERLAEGEMPMPSTLARALVSQARRRRPEPLSRPVLLTPREQQALLLLSEGLSNKQIARRLNISEHGAKRHVANVLAKLNCPNRTLAVALAIKEGLLTEG